MTTTRVDNRIMKRMLSQAFAKRSNMMARDELSLR